MTKRDQIIVDAFNRHCSDEAVLIVDLPLDLPLVITVFDLLAFARTIMYYQACECSKVESISSVDKDTLRAIRNAGGQEV